MKFVDSHCHPQFPQYDSDRNEVIKRALTAGVRMICVGTDYAMSRKAIELAQKYNGVWASVGLHPNDVNHESRILNYGELVDDSKVVAIGEVGLDYYRTTEPEKQELQRKVFNDFIDLAIKVQKPLIIHCRNAHADMLEILRHKAYSLQPTAGVVHSFTGTWDDAKKYIDLGFYIGLNGIITFTDQYNEVVINAPLDRILLETDAPYLTPVPHRGQRNEPLYVKLVAKKTANLRKIPIERVAEVTTQNTRKVFRVD